jgi:two-component system, LytTR family, sensor kinase
MKSSKFPVRNLIRLNLGMSLITFFLVFGFLFLFLGDGFFGATIIFSLITSLMLIFKVSLNLAILFLLEKHYDINSRRFKGLRYILSFSLNVCADTVVFLIIASINQQLLNLIFLLIIAFVILSSNTIIILLQDYIILSHFKVQADLENSQLKTARAEAANQLLRQQIHPHFLFNALNTLKSLYKINPAAAEEYLVRLSDFLRASVSNNNLKTTRLRDEIKLCVDYLEMQKIRFGNALAYSISISDEKLDNGYVPSFAIQTLLENAIKHNELTNESPLSITVKSTDDRISVINNLRYKATSEASTGSGLTNLSERYRIISKDELHIEKDNDLFSVSIKILENADSNHRGRETDRRRPRCNHKIFGTRDPDHGVFKFGKRSHRLPERER